MKNENKLKAWQIATRSARRNGNGGAADNGTEESHVTGAPLRLDAKTHFFRANKCVSVPRRCKSCAVTSRFPEKCLFDALCYQILAHQICDRALYGSVVKLPGFASTEEAMVLLT
ncbi:hypothetical protein ISCGN_025421 [Ixodes scapularis]